MDSGNHKNMKSGNAELTIRVIGQVQDSLYEALHFRLLVVLIRELLLSTMLVLFYGPTVVEFGIPGTFEGLSECT